MQYCLFIIHIEDVFCFPSFSLKYNNDIDKTRDYNTDEKSKKLRQTSAEILVKQKEKHKCFLYGFFF